MAASTPSPPPLALNKPLTFASRVRLLVLMLVFLLGASTLLLLPLWDSQGGVLQLTIGDLSPDDIVAPQTLTYISDIQTNQAREAAAAAVDDIYRPPDTRVVRQQVTRARNMLTYISNVRADIFATSELKIGDLQALSDVTLTPEIAAALINLSEDQWNAIQPEVLRVIELVMSQPVTEPRLPDARAQIPQLVSVNLSVTEADLVATLARPMVQPNSLFDETATMTARQAARDTIAPVTVVFVQGQTVVERGRLINELDYEALQKLGILEPVQESPWQEPVARVSSVVLVLLIVSGYLWRVRPGLRRRERDLALAVILILGLLAASAWIVPNSIVGRYLIPMSGVAMLLSVLLGAELAILLSVMFGVLIGVLSGGQLDLSLFLTLGAVMAVITLGKAKRVSAFFWAGLAAGAINCLVILAFRLADVNSDVLGLITLLVAGLTNGLFSGALGLLGLFIISPLFDLATSLRLIELMRPDHPLLQDLLRKAPGTYQHSLQIANLTEQAAEAIDADALLCRVGSLYHDIGKGNHPMYFVENLAGEENPHDRLDPLTSVRIIIGHVTDGIEMGRKARLPSAIIACIAEHHGTSLAYYQYSRALAAANGDEEQVAAKDFSYPGPKPRSRETALLMLADGCEAKTRADLPTTEDEVREIVNTIFDSRLREGQLENSGLTFGELELVRESFITTLKGVYHARIKYPPALSGQPRPTDQPSQELNNAIDDG